MRKVNWTLLITGMLLLTELVFGALPEYEIIDLGTLGGPSSYPSGINDAGQVVGNSRTADGLGRGFLWDDVNGMSELGSNVQSAIAINNNGQIVGSPPLTGSFVTTYFIWDSETGFVELTAFERHVVIFPATTARAINDSVQVVGTTFIRGLSEPPGIFLNLDYHASLWDSINGITDLGTLGGRDSFAYNINESGIVVGASTTGILYKKAHAFLWDSINGMTDLGTLRNNDSSAWAINNFDKVVGTSVINEPDENERAINHAFVWTSKEGMIDIHDSSYLSSIAVEINDADQVVGIISTNMHIDHLRGIIGFGGIIGSPWEPAQNQSSAFLWDKRYGMVDLNDLLDEDSGWDHLSSAKGINNKGQIVGYGVTNDGERHGFLMTPIQDSLYISLNIQNAIDENYEALETIDAALDKEWTVVDALNEMLASRDFGDLNRRDIRRAKLSICISIYRQMRSKTELRRSIKGLERSLDLLNAD
jgi:probable HAF family extracellular repeat protein